MARTAIKVAYTCSFEEAEKRTEQILVKSGFKKIEKKGESVWKKGTGLATAMQFAKVEFDASEVTLYGWVQVGIGSVGGREMDLKGITAIIPKKSLMSVLNKVKSALEN